LPSQDNPSHAASLAIIAMSSWLNAAALVNMSGKGCCSMKYHKSRHFVMVKDGSGGVVEFWTVRAISNEPTDYMREARDTLRNALRKLSAQENEIVEAQFSGDAAKSDVENLLFYNLRPGTFENCAATGLRFSQSHKTLHDAPAGMKCRYVYRLTSRKSTKRKPIVSLEFSLPRFNSSSKVHEIWCAAKQGSASAPNSGVHSGPFDLRVKVTGNVQTNAASLVKRLFDGIISSLHFDPGPDEEAIKRLSTACSERPCKIRAMLGCNATAILGQKDTLVSPTSKYVKWSPADDRCAAGELWINGPVGENRSSGENVLVNAKLFASEGPED
jgi:hypothetical protein